MVLVLLGCQVDKPLLNEPPLEISKGSEESVVLQCSPWLYNRPSKVSELEQNVLVDHFIEADWMLQKTEGGIFFEIKEPGGSVRPAWGDKVLVHYVGRDLDLNVFDSSYRRGRPLEFYVGNVIQGWNEVLPMLGEGGRGIFVIPANKAYGEDGFGDLVSPGQHLIFDIQLLEILEEEKK